MWRTTEDAFSIAGLQTHKYMWWSTCGHAHVLSEWHGWHLNSTAHSRLGSFGPYKTPGDLRA